MSKIIYNRFSPLFADTHDCEQPKLKFVYKYKPAVVVPAETVDGPFKTKVCKMEML